MSADRRWKSLAACAAAAACASGCMTAPIYHESWSAQVKAEAGTCPDVDGTYRNAGEAFEKDRHVGFKPQRLSLAHVLNEGYGYADYDAPERLGATAYLASNDSHETISLMREGDVLHVVGTRAAGETRSFDLKLHGECRDSLFPVESEWGYDLFMAAAARAAYSLGRAEDGSLLVYARSGGVLLGVIAGSNAFWVRFPPADTARVAAAVSPGPTAP